MKTKPPRLMLAESLMVIYMRIYRVVYYHPARTRPALCAC